MRCVHMCLQARVPPLTTQRFSPPEAPPSLFCSMGRIPQRLSQWKDGARFRPADADRRRAEGALRGRQNHPERLQEIQGAHGVMGSEGASNIRDKGFLLVRGEP